jgi:type IV pilus assembly protein PilB
MPRQKLGELLRRHVPLTIHDIDEILHEQSHTRRRFGDVAMSLGMCTPQDIWRAWCEQIRDSIERVDLDQLGIDSQAIALVPPELAFRCKSVPVRCTDTHLVVATTDDLFDLAVAEVPQLLHRRIRFVIAPSAQVERALAQYYGPRRRAG